MAQPMSRPSPVVLPRPGGDIIIRQFHPKDADQRNHPITPHRRGTSPAAFRASHILVRAGVMVSLQQEYRPSNKRRHIDSRSHRTVHLYATVHYKNVRGLCANARATDMADICHSYEVPIPVDGVQAPVPQGPAGFWVAAIESPESKTSEVVGYLGLDYRGGATAISDPSTGELRRMIVSMNHRRAQDRLASHDRGDGPRTSPPHKTCLGLLKMPALRRCRIETQAALLSSPDSYLALISYATHFPAEWYQPEINTLARRREQWHFGGGIGRKLAVVAVSANRVRNDSVADEIIEWQTGSALEGQT
ncbi:hypothetical protein B0H14DRAFT_3127420 [Mycena olivaceomarginata]|nr:hypothetical protein B0H14DRAFT_3127420 [Mycena olivaceomarginata]